MSNVLQIHSRNKKLEDKDKRSHSCQMSMASFYDHLNLRLRKQYLTATSLKKIFSVAQKKTYKALILRLTQMHLFPKEINTYNVFSDFDHFWIWTNILLNH